MINRFFFKTLGFSLLLAWSLADLQGCASQSVMLVHPQSGATIKCGAAGAGIMARSAEGFVEDCLRAYERQGYVPEDKLTPGQRADLERRGILPKPEPPTFRMGY